MASYNYKNWKRSPPQIKHTKRANFVSLSQDFQTTTYRQTDSRHFQVCKACIVFYLMTVCHWHWVSVQMMEKWISAARQDELYSLFGRWGELLFQEPSFDHSPAIRWEGLQTDHFLKNNNSKCEREKTQSHTRLLSYAEQCPGGRHGDATARYLVPAPSLRGSSSAPPPVRHRRPLAQSGRGSGSSSCLQEIGLQPLSVQTGLSERWISTVEMGCIFICTKITGREFFVLKEMPVWDRKSY